MATELLSWANRPTDEDGMMVRAKACINDAVLWANRSHAFKYAEKVMRLTYPAGAFMVDLNSMVDRKVVGINTVQLVTPGEFSGYPIEVCSYEGLQTLRRRNYRTSGICYAGDDKTAIAIKNTDGYAMFTLGTSVGLFPKPSVDLELLVTYNGLIDQSVLDTDTNFMYEFGHDFILTKALQKFNTFIKADKRIDVTDAQLSMEWESMKSWNLNVSYSHAVLS
jgi:hypothetical protein